MEKLPYISVKRARGATVVRFHVADLSGLTLAEIVKMELSSIVAQQRPSRLIVDFTGVKMITSSIIGAMVTVSRHLRELGGAMYLCSVPVPIQEVYRNLNLSGTMFTVCDSVQDALETTAIQPPNSQEQMED